MSVLDIIKSISPFTPIISLLAVGFIYCVNYLNVTALERKLMTNIKKLGINLSVPFFFFITFTILLDLYAISFNIITVNSWIEFIISLIAAAIIVIVPVGSVTLIVYVINSIFKRKEKYLVQLADENQNQKMWQVMRRVNKKELLLYDGESSYKFIDNNTLATKFFYREVDELSESAAKIVLFFNKNRNGLSFTFTIISFVSAVIGHIFDSYRNLAFTICFIAALLYGFTFLMPKQKN